MNIEYIRKMPPTVDDLDSLLHEKFAIRHKIHIGGDRGVLTATDRNMFAGLQLLYYSLTLSHDIRFAVIDLGMSKQQLGWCRKMGIELLEMPNNLIFPDKYSPCWQNWNKPTWIEHSPFQETLWLDADVVIRGSLSHPFEVLSERPFIVEDYFSADPSMVANNEAIYTVWRKLFLLKDRSNIMPNNGVLGIVRGRDQYLLDAWKYACSMAYNIPATRTKFSWYDQGALIWALESVGKTTLIRKREWAYNFPGGCMADAKNTVFDDCKDVFDYLETLPVPDAPAIRHYAGPHKPWNAWKESHKHFPIDLSGSVSQKMRVLVLGHFKSKLEKRRMRSYLRYVNLNDLEIGEHQTNELAESRIYLDPNLMGRFEGMEYVGLGSERWNDKYFGWGAPDLEELHEFRDKLSPKSILVPKLITDENWCKCTTEVNIGLQDMLDELTEFTGMPLLNGPSFWANNYICHRDVLEEYVGHFRRVYDHFYGKYKNRFPFRGMDLKRTPAFFYEAVTVHYFANRLDLKIVNMRKGNRMRLA